MEKCGGFESIKVSFHRRTIRLLDIKLLKTGRIRPHGTLLIPLCLVIYALFHTGVEIGLFIFQVRQQSWAFLGALNVIRFSPLVSHSLNNQLKINTLEQQVWAGFILLWSSYLTLPNRQANFEQFRLSNLIEVDSKSVQPKIHWSQTKRFMVDATIMILFLLLNLTTFLGGTFIQINTRNAQNISDEILQQVLDAQNQTGGLLTLAQLPTLFNQLTVAEASVTRTIRLSAGLHFGWLLIMVILFLPAALKTDQSYQNHLNVLRKLCPSQVSEGTWRPQDVSLDRALDQVPRRSVTAVTAREQMCKMISIQRTFRAKCVVFFTFLIIAI